MIEELAGSPRYAYSYANSSGGGERVFICDWNEIQTVVDTMGPQGLTAPNGWIYTLHNVNVEPYSENGRTVCPVPGTNPAEYSKARVTLTFGPYQFAGTRSVTLYSIDESHSSGYDMVPVDTGNLVIYGHTSPNGGFTLPSPVNYMSVRRPVLEITFSITRYGMLPGQIISMLGHVNSVPFIAPRSGLVFAPGRVHYSNYSLSQIGYFGDTPRWQYKCVFSAIQNDWDTVYDPGVGNWVFLSKDFGVTPLALYPRSNLNAVLQ